MDKILEMRRKRAELVAQARALVEKAEKENRNLSAEEKQQYDKIFKDIEDIKEKIDREEKLLEEERALQKTLTSAGREIPEKQAQDSRMVAFRKWIVSGPSSLTADEMRALSVSSDPAGGYLVPPQEFVASLIKKIDDSVFVRKYATIMRLEKAKTIGIPTIDTDPADADWTSELLTGSEDSSLAFGKREMTPNPLAKRIKVSNKLLRVSAIPVEDLVRDRLAYKFGISLEKAYLTGDGSSKPLGLFTASNSGIPTSRDVTVGDPTDGVSADGLLDVKYSLKGQYWGRAVWILHRDIVKQIAKLKDGMGQYLWKPGLAGTEPDTLCGRPLLVSEYAPSTVSDGSYVCIFGDLSMYYIVDALDMTLQRLVELYAETNQTGFIGRYEGDGAPVLAEAFVRGKIVAA